MRYYVQLFGDWETDPFTYEIFIFEVLDSSPLKIGDTFEVPVDDLKGGEVSILCHVKHLNTAGTRFSISEDAQELPGIMAISHAQWHRENFRPN